MVCTGIVSSTMANVQGELSRTAAIGERADAIVLVCSNMRLISASERSNPHGKDADQLTIAH